MARCSVCNDLTKRDTSYGELSFSFAISGRTPTAPGACLLCLTIFSGIRAMIEETLDNLIQKIDMMHARCFGVRGEFAETLQVVVTFSDNSPPAHLEYYSIGSDTTKFPAVLPRTNVSTHPLSDEGLAWARSRLAACMLSHPSCVASGLRSLPKRLLAMTKKPGDSSVTVKLVEIRSDFIGSYAALSHRWGERRGLTLTKRFLNYKRDSFSWVTMPKTFRDAITFALKLDIRYIWIDSLCVIQDDTRDWEIESAKMADIYEHAVLTLAATASKGDTEGCLPDSEPASKHVEIIDQNGVASGIAVRRRLRHWNKTTASDPAHFPLLSRGWVLQERLLSPRILHFCSSELVWECREQSICECGGLNQAHGAGAVFHSLTKLYEKQSCAKTNFSPPIPKQSLWARMKRHSLAADSEKWTDHDAEAKSALTAPRRNFRKSWSASSVRTTSSINPTYTPPTGSFAVRTAQHTPDALPSTNRDDIPSYVSQYHRLVEQYTALALTRDSDRLPAFSGICARIQHFRGAYLAGLWSDSLCFDLMWYVDRHKLWDRNATRSEHYTGPTWSWASAAGPVQYWPDLLNYTDTVQHFLGGIGNDETSKSPSTPLILNRAKISHQVKVPGKNPFGSVKSAVLVVEASYTNASLGWLSYSTGYSETEYGKYQYKVNICIDSEESPASIPMLADYSLHMEGAHQMAEGEHVSVLLVHPHVSLVLRPVIHGGRHVRMDGHSVWARIGIVRLSSGFEDQTALDWMRDSDVGRFHIV